MRAAKVDGHERGCPAIQAWDVAGACQCAKRVSTPRTRVADDFSLHCRARDLPTPVREFRFHPVRKWRFDWAFPDLKLAVEVEGVTFHGGTLGGRHVSASGFTKDLEKYAAAFVLGWSVLRVLPRQLRSGQAADWVQARIWLTRTT